MKKRILVLEPFYGGSHKHLIDLMLKKLEVDFDIDLVVQTAKKWHWRARSSALWFSEQISQEKAYSYLFTSSVLNLCELLGLRPDLNKTRKDVFLKINLHSLFS